MTKRIFGDIPDYPEGTYFESRVEASRAGVHRPTQGGISGSATEGADSIVVSGGYEDDRDLGTEIVYIGHGGRDPETGEQVADQELSSGNRALIYSSDHDLPVRVIRGANSRSQYAPKAGYRYDGLYKVEKYWQDNGRSGHMIWCFRLKKLNPDTAPWKATPPLTLLAEIAKRTQTARKSKKSDPVVKPYVVGGQDKPRPPLPSILTFHVGDKVKHAVFGEGVVSEVKASGPHDQTVTADFVSVGNKTLLASKANLDLLS